MNNHQIVEVEKKANTTINIHNKGSTPDNKKEEVESSETSYSSGI